MNQLNGNRLDPVNFINSGSHETSHGFGSMDISMHTPGATDEVLYRACIDVVYTDQRIYQAAVEYHGSSKRPGENYSGVKRSLSRLQAQWLMNKVSKFLNEEVKYIPSDDELKR